MRSRPLYDNVPEENFGNNLLSAFHNICSGDANQLIDYWIDHGLPTSTANALKGCQLVAVTHNSVVLVCPEWEVTRETDASLVALEQWLHSEYHASTQVILYVGHRWKNNAAEWFLMPTSKITCRFHRPSRIHALEHRR